MSRDPDEILEGPAQDGGMWRKAIGVVLHRLAVEHGVSGWVWLGLGGGIERIHDEDLGGRC